MDIGLNLNTNLEVRTELNIMLSPKMLQTLKILNMPYAELVENISNEVENNPLLDFEKKDTMIEYLKFQSSLPYREKDEKNNDPIELEKFIKSTTTLSQHLIRQIEILDTTDEQKEIVKYLVKNLDQNGYLKNYDEIKQHIANDLSVDPKEVDKALEILQGFEPEGIGARNLKECLLIQINEYGFESNELKDLLKKIVSNHLDDLAENNFEKITNALDIGKEGIKAAADFIKGYLTPFPGSKFSENPIPAIPSFAVKKSKSGIEIVNLESKYGPSLKLNPQYLKLLEDPNIDEKTISYIKENLKKAKEFIANIQKRHETIEKVIKKIVETQKDFLEGKEKFPKPLTQRELSEEFGLHPSTISRTIAEKYIESPIGIIKVKALCPRRVLGLTSALIKAEIEKIIANENRQKPLTDLEILQKLLEKGIFIKRRTVADYRKKLSLSTYNKRKNF